MLIASRLYSNIFKTSSKDCRIKCTLNFQIVSLLLPNFTFTLISIHWNLEICHLILYWSLFLRTKLSYTQHYPILHHFTVLCWWWMCCRLLSGYDQTGQIKICFIYLFMGCLNINGSLKTYASFFAGVSLKSPCKTGKSEVGFTVYFGC